MDHREVGRYWDANAETWTRLSRAGYDVYRDHLNTPAFLAMLPDVEGLYGVDIGCGEGHNTRAIARRGAHLVGIDIAEPFVRHAIEAEAREPLGVDYGIASALELPFAEACFDFATAIMSLMDVPEVERALAEAYRVLRPGGFLQLSISHPCFDAPHRRNLRDAHGRTRAIEVGEYFAERDGEISEWIFGATPEALKRELPRFRVPRFTRTLAQWLNGLIDAGFDLERVGEPAPSDETVRAHPELQDARIVAYFLHLRAGKPAGARAGIAGRTSTRAGRSARSPSPRPSGGP